MEKLRNLTSISFIVFAIAYNLISLENKNYGFMDKDMMHDIWFCSMYLNFYCLFYLHKKNIYARIAMIASGIRLVYNFGILIGLIEHTEFKTTYFVPGLTLIVVIYYNIKHKWQL